MATSIFEALANRYDPANDYETRPAAWIKDKAGEYTTRDQQRILESVVKNRYTAVPSAHDLGKSYTASRIAGWWNDTFGIESFVVSTAPTAAQVSAILWREIAKLHKKAQLRGRINRAGYPQWFDGAQLVGYGRKPADYEESAFQGIHEKFVLVIIDEAGGVARHLYDAVDALATNEYARVLAIGNPDDPASHFASISKPGSGWNVIHLDGLRSPNMTKERVIGRKSQGFGYANPRYPLLWALMRAEKIPFSTEPTPEDIRPLLVSPLWIEERIRRWAGLSETASIDFSPDELEEIVRRRCSASALFTAKVRGLFPTTGATGVIPLGWVQRAVERWHDLYDGGYTGETSLKAATSGRKVLGLDVAREGADESALAIRYGNICERVITTRIPDTTELADWTASFMNEPGAITVVDVDGIGGGVYDVLRRQHREGLVVGSVFPFNAAASSQRVDAIGAFRFRNDRSAAWWNMRELLDPSKGSNIALPDDERLIEELIAPKYDHHVGGILVVEPKKDIRKRIGRSTDSADAVIQSFWLEANPPRVEAVEWGSGADDSGVVRYDGYTPFSDDDFGGSGQGTFSKPGLGYEWEDWR